MANLSITNAWNEASAFVRREARLLFPIAFLLGALPGVLIQLLAPQQPVAPGQMPEAGAWLLLMPVSFLLTIVSSVAIAYLALRPGISVGDALGRALRRFLPVLGAFLIIGIAGGLLIFILSVVAVALVPGAAGAASGQTPGPELLAAIGLAFLLMLPVLFYFMAKLSLTMPVAAAEDVGPGGIIARSWQLTRGHFWKILGFILLFALAVVVAMLAVQVVVGSLVSLAAGPPDPGTIGFFILLLLNAVLSAVFSMYLGVTLARIYAQLSGDGIGEVFR